MNGSLTYSPNFYFCLGETALAASAYQGKEISVIMFKMFIRFIFLFLVDTNTVVDRRQCRRHFRRHLSAEFRPTTCRPKNSPYFRPKFGNFSQKCHFRPKWPNFSVWANFRLIFGPNFGVGRNQKRSVGRSLTNRFSCSKPG